MDCGPKTYRSGARWIYITDLSNLPSNAVIGGEEEDGQPLFIGRALLHWGVLPGKINSHLKKFYMPYSNDEYDSSSCEVLTIDDGQSVEWVKADNGHIPNGALQGGVTTVQEPLYIARFEHKGLLIPGKLHSSLKNAYVSYRGKEIKSKSYEVLCVKTINF